MAGLYHPTWDDESDELRALCHEAFEAFRDDHPELEDQVAYLMGDPDGELEARIIAEIEADLDAMHAQRRFDETWVDPEPVYDDVLEAYVPF